MENLCKPLPTVSLRRGRPRQHHDQRSSPSLTVLVSFRAMQVELLIPDRPKVRFQTKKNTEVYAVRGSSRFTSRTPRLLIRCDSARDADDGKAFLRSA